MRGRQGFTMIELMVSLAVMTVGAAAMFALQGYVARSNLHARQLTTATQILETWTERLKADALNFTQPGSAGAPAATLGNTRYLQTIANSPGIWVPAGTNADLVHSPGFDANGIDVLPLVQSDIAFCTSYRLAWTVAGDTIRADVRVYWPQEGSLAVLATDFPLCAGTQTAIDPTGALFQHYHSVHSSVVLRWIPLP